MGKKHRHIGLWIAVGLVALVVLLMVGVQVGVNSRFAKEKLNSVLSSGIDGEIDWSRIDFSVVKCFPLFRVTIDTLSLTYDHDKFAAWDDAGAANFLLSAGRGAEKDTLACLDRITAAVDLWELISGKLRLKDAHINNLGAFMHKYDSTTTNLAIFHFPSKEKDTTKVTTTPVISIGDVYIAGTRAVYTDQESGIFARALMDRIGVSGKFRFDDGGEFKLRRVALAIDTLVTDARVPSDSAHVDLNRLFVKEVSKDMYDLGLDLDAFARTGKYGDLLVPVALDGRAGISFSEGHTDIEVPELKGTVAHIPLHVAGNAGMYADSTVVKADAEFSRCPLDTLLAEYLVKFVDVAREVETNAVMDLSVSADGVLSDKTVPEVKASLKIPKSRVAYHPLGIDGNIVLDVEGRMSPKKVIDAVVNELTASMPGASIQADGSVKNLLGWDPAFKVFADADADLATVSRFLPAKLGMKLDGDMCLQVHADGRKSYITNMEFDKGKLKASLKGDRIALRMPGDTLDARLFRPDLNAEMNPDGINISILSDSAYFAKGANLEGKVRRMDNKAVLTKVESRGQLTPFIDVDHVDRGISLRAGNNWFRLRNADICLNATKTVRPVMDSAMVARMRAERDSMRRRQSMAPTDGMFHKNDVDISLNSTISNYLRQWSPKAKVSLGMGFVSMPVLPLRTALGRFEGDFDGDKLTVDTLSARVGTSHVSLKGAVSGLRRSLQRKGRINADVDLYSRRINVNEIFAAFNAGKKNEGAVYAENDESFIVDSLAVDSLTVIEAPLIVLPSNVNAKLGVLVDEVDYSDIVVKPLSAMLNLRDRTVQLTEGKVNTNMGNIGVDAFYSARSRDDISAGVDLGVYDVSADSLIHLLPTVDSLMPVLKSFKGKLNCEASALTQIDTNMNVVIPSLEGVIHISGSDLNVDDAGGLVKITKLLRFKNPNIGHIDDLDVNAVIHDSKVDVFPFMLGMDRYRLALHGMQGLDKSMYYHASIIKSPFLIRFGINVFGTFDKWSFNIGLPKYKDGNLPVFTKQIDTMRFDISNTIVNVFERSAEELRNFNSAAQLVQRQRELGYESGGSLMTRDESISSEQLAFEYEAMLAEEELQAEVDAVLEDSFREIESVMKDYETQIYDKKILRKMERLAKKQARKAARKSS